MVRKSEYLRDYKFYCFNGSPQYSQVISNRDVDEEIDFFDMNWDRIEGLVGLVVFSSKIHNNQINGIL